MSYSRKALQNDFGAAAAVYDKHAKLQQRVLGHLAALAKGYAAEGGIVLDVGCGTGLLAEMWPEWSGKMIGVDLAEGMCTQAQGRHLRVACADAVRLPLARESASIVFSSLMAQWVEDHAGMLKEFHRVGMPGGMLAISLFTEGTLMELAHAMQSGDGHAHVSRFVSFAHFRQQAVEAGWQVIFAQEQKEMEYHATFEEVLHPLRAIGAGDKREERARGLMHPRVLQRAEQHYRHCYGTSEGLPVSWNVGYLLCRKSG